MAVLLLYSRIDKRVFKYIDYTELEEVLLSLFYMKVDTRCDLLQGYTIEPTVGCDLFVFSLLKVITSSSEDYLHLLELYFGSHESPLHATLIVIC